MSEQHQVVAVQRAMETGPGPGSRPGAGPRPPGRRGEPARVGVVGKIVKMVNKDEENVQFLINTLERFCIEEIAESRDGYLAKVHYEYGAEFSVNPELKAYSMAASATLKELVQINPLYSEEIKMFLPAQASTTRGRLADFAADLTSSDGQELQQVLETFDVKSGSTGSYPPQERAGGFKAADEDHQADRGEDQRPAARVFPERTAKGDQEGAGAREGKEDRRGREVRGAPEGAQPQSRGAARGHRRDREVQAPGAFLARVPRDPQLPGLAHHPPLGKFSKDSYNLEKARRILDRDHHGLADVKERIPSSSPSAR